MTLVTMYILPMILGRTYDMAQESVGVDIFPREQLDRYEEIKNYITDSKYRMVTNTDEARDFLEVQGDLALRIKAGMIDLQGVGSYLKEAASRSNTVEILVKVHYETVTRTLPSNAQPLPNWRTIDRSHISTHYARSITYGGDLIAALRFKASNSNDREFIKAKATATLQSQGNFGIDMKGDLEKLKESLKNVSSMEISYFATVPIKVVPNSIESLIDLVQDFPKQTQQVNNGIGVPLRMELFPLSSLGNDISPFILQTSMNDLSAHLEEDFDDIRAAKRALADWMEKVPPYIPAKFNEEIGDFNTRLEHLTMVFYRTISNLDMSIHNPKQFQEALEEYHGDTGDMPDKYFREFLKLRDRVIEEVPELQTMKNSETYTVWGSVSCATKDSETVLTGSAVTSDATMGGAVDTLCLPDKIDGTIAKPDSRFLSLAHPKLDGLPSDQFLGCAVCRLYSRTGITMIPGETSCPPEWTEEYKGTLMASKKDARRSTALCVRDLPALVPGPKVTSSQSSWGQVLYSCGTLRCGSGDNDKPLPCVVCSR